MSSLPPNFPQRPKFQGTEPTAPAQPTPPSAPQPPVLPVAPPIPAFPQEPVAPPQYHSEPQPAQYAAPVASVPPYQPQLPYQNVPQGSQMSYSGPLTGNLPPTSPTPNRRRLVLIIAGAVVALLVIVLVATNLIPRPKSTPVVQSSGTHSSTPKSTPKTATPTSGVISLDQNVTKAGMANAPAWGIPYLTTNDWAATVVDQNGVNSFNNSITGCAYISEQDESSYTDSDRSDSPKLTQDFLTEFTKSSTGLKSETGKSTDISVGAAGSKLTAEFTRTNITYTGTNGTNYTLALVDRNMSNVPVSMSLIYSCPTSSFQESDLQTLLGQTYLDVTPVS
jgi:hypothetical protein